METTVKISAKQLLSWMKKNGIKNLEDFAEKTANHLNPAQISAALRADNHEAVPITAAMLKKAFITEDIPAPKQALVAKPFKLEGVTYDAEDIGRFDGKALYFYVNDALIANGHLKAFSSKSSLRNYLKETEQIAEDFETQMESGQLNLRNHVSGVPSRFFEHSNFTGARIDLPYRHAFWNLEEHTLSGWWFWRVSWNDKISSIQTADRALNCYEHSALGGRMLTVGRNTNLGYVGAFWNDRISSVIESWW